MGAAPGVPRLLWISPGEGVGDELLRRLRALVRGGLRGFQLREKASYPRDLLVFARRARAVLEPSGGILLVNDRIDVALAAGAEGAHLGSASLPAAEARRLLGPERLLGVSVHDRDELERALEGNPDYVVASPVFPVRKRGMPPRPPLGLGRLAELCAASPVPVLALGGLRPERVGEVRAAGAAGVAVLSDLARSPDPAARVAQYLEALA